MLGSFENNIGNFYGKDIFNGKPISVQFKWDVTNPLKPIWSQAFSADQANMGVELVYVFFQNG